MLIVVCKIQTNMCRPKSFKVTVALCVLTMYNVQHLFGLKVQYPLLHINKSNPYNDIRIIKNGIKEEGLIIAFSTSLHTTN